MQPRILNEKGYGTAGVTQYLAVFKAEKEFFTEGDSATTTFGCTGAVVLASVLSGSTQADQVSHITGLPVQFVAAVLSVLEQDFVRRKTGRACWTTCKVPSRFSARLINRYEQSSKNCGCKPPTAGAGTYRSPSTHLGQGSSLEGEGSSGSIPKPAASSLLASRTSSAARVAEVSLHNPRHDCQDVSPCL